MNWKLLYLDIDGTIVAPGAPPEERASQRLIESIERLQTAGIQVGFTTARSLEACKGLISSLRPQAPLILENGARIYDPIQQTYIFKSAIKPVTVQHVLPLIEAYAAYIYTINDTGRHQYMGTTISANVYKITILNILQAQADQLVKLLSRANNVIVSRSISQDNPPRESVHITSTDSGKGKALMYICSTRQIELSNVIGIGDSYNDWDFLQYCGLRVAVGNAINELKNRVDQITLPYWEDGVATYIESIRL